MVFLSFIRRREKNKVKTSVGLSYTTFFLDDFLLAVVVPRRCNDDDNNVIGCGLLYVDT